MKGKITLLIFLAIIILAAFLRLYRIGDYMLFLGDEGRDALVVKRMIVDHKFTLLGPTTSVGAMFLGPIYYYFMLPFLWTTRLDPVGPAIMVALFSLATICLIYKFSQEFFEKKMGLIAAFLYAISPLVIIHSHSSWNPNVLPFFSLLIIYSLAKIVVQKKDGWLLVTGISFGIALQLHYLSLILVIVIFACLLLRRFKIRPKYLFSGFFGWLLAISPFLFFETRHSFPITQTMIRFVTAGTPGSPDSFNFGVDRFAHNVNDVAIRIFWRLITFESDLLAKTLLALSIIGIIYFLKQLRKKEKEKYRALMIISLWFFLGVTVLSLYRGSIYDYYFVFLFPCPFLILGFLFSKTLENKILIIPTVLLLMYLAIVNLANTPISRLPSRLVAQTQEISRFVLLQTQGEPYNFALIASQNSDYAYRYFLEIWGQPPVVIQNSDLDPQRKTVTNQLLVVCEEKECKPLGHPLWEIAGFGMAQIEEEWQVGLIKVLKLSHYQSIR
jgi:4-amino-4-deoxy-L-arabinose transferase-like glycosyltransferase